MTGTDSKPVQRTSLDTILAAASLNDIPFNNSRTTQSRRTKRSTSRENFVETLVVVDKEMTRYHGLDKIQAYVLTIMNMVC